MCWCLFVVGHSFEYYVGLPAFVCVFTLSFVRYQKLLPSARIVSFAAVGLFGIHQLFAVGVALVCAPLCVRKVFLVKKGRSVKKLSYALSLTLSLLFFWLADAPSLFPLLCHSSICLFACLFSLLHFEPLVFFPVVLFFCVVPPVAVIALHLLECEYSTLPVAPSVPYCIAFWLSSPFFSSVECTILEERKKQFVTVFVFGSKRIELISASQQLFRCCYCAKTALRVVVVVPYFVYSSRALSTSSSLLYYFPSCAVNGTCPVN